MNANNADNAVEVEATPLEKISGIIFDLGNDGKIPEGDYLNLMNSMKKLYDDMQKRPAIQQPQNRVHRPAIPINWEYDELENRVIVNGDMPNYHRVIMTRHYETKLYILRRIQMEANLNGGDRKIFFLEKNDLSTVRSGKLNMIIRVFSAGNTYKFMKITKINTKSIKYDILYINANNQGRIKKDCKLSFKNGEYFENFSEYATKQILIYNTSAVACDELITDFRRNSHIEFFLQTMETLTIWN